MQESSQSEVPKRQHHSWNNYGGVFFQPLKLERLPSSSSSSLEFKLDLAGLYMHLAVYPGSRVLTLISSKTGIKEYRSYYSNSSQLIIWTFSLLLLFLSFVEDGPSKWPQHFTLPLEFLSLFVLLYKLQQKRRFMGAQQFTRDASSIIHLCILLILSLDFLVAMLDTIDLGSIKFYRYMRALRPLVILDHASSIRGRFMDMGVSAYHARTMFLLLSYNLVFFAVIGTILFHSTSEGEAYFNDFTTSLMTLIVLQTTSNHPAVIVKSFTEDSRWTELYFLFFLLMSHFLMLNLMLSVIYHELSHRLRQAAAQELLHSHVASRISFAILMDDLGTYRNDLPDKVDYMMVVQMLSQEFSLTFHQAKQLLDHCRGPEDEEFRDFGLSRQAFGRIPTLVRFQRSMQSQDDEMGENPHGYQHMLRTLFTRQVFLNLTLVDIFVVCSLCGLLLVTVFVLEDTTSRQTLPTVSWYAPFLTFVFFCELCLKLLAFGYFRFSDDLWNVFDTILVGCSILGEFGAGDDKTSLILCDAILMRLLRVVPGFRNITGAAAAFFPAVAPSIYAILIVFYSLAIVMVGTLGDVRLKTYNANDFRDFVAALVTLFELAVVNDWNETMASFVEATGSRQVEIFFVAWWALSQLVLFNSVTSLVLDGFEVRMKELHALGEDSSSGSESTSPAVRKRFFAEEEKNSDRLAILTRLSSPALGSRKMPLARSSSFTVGRMFVELFRNVSDPTEQEVDAACWDAGFRVGKPPPQPVQAHEHVLG